MICDGIIMVYKTVEQWQNRSFKPVLTCNDVNEALKFVQKNRMRNFVIAKHGKVLYAQYANEKEASHEPSIGEASKSPERTGA